MQEPDRFLSFSHYAKYAGLFDYSQYCIDIMIMYLLNIDYDSNKYSYIKISNWCESMCIRMIIYAEYLG